MSFLFPFPFFFFPLPLRSCAASIHRPIWRQRAKNIKKPYKSHLLLHPHLFLFSSSPSWRSRSPGRAATGNRALATERNRMTGRGSNVISFLPSPLSFPSPSPSPSPLQILPIAGIDVDQPRKRREGPVESRLAGASPSFSSFLLPLPPPSFRDCAPRGDRIGIGIWPYLLPFSFFTTLSVWYRL